MEEEEKEVWFRSEEGIFVRAIACAELLTAGESVPDFVGTF